MKLYLYKYNNYFNRIVKKENSLANYGTPYIISGVNFNPADGVNTTIICGTSDFQGLKDYCIVVDDSNSNAIVSRWFIIEENRTRNGQYELQLKRDLMVDYYDNIVQAPIMIDRAMIADENNPLLFNPEGFSFNQIKKQEYLLADGLRARWAVMYFKKSYLQKQITVPLADSSFDMSISSTIASYFPTANQWVGNTQVNNFYLRALTGVDYTTGDLEKWRWTVKGSTTSNVSSTPITDTAITRPMIWFDEKYNTIKNSVNSMLATNFNTLKTTYISESGMNSCTLEQYNEWSQIQSGTKIKDSDNRIWIVTINTMVNDVDRYITTGTTRTAFNTMIANSGIETTGSYGDQSFGVSATTRQIYVSYREVVEDAGVCTFTLFPNADPKVKTNDSEFNIVALPYDAISFFYDGTYQYSNPDTAQKVIRAITLNNADIVDLQLLPYCPYQYAIDGGYLNVREDLDPSQYEVLEHQIPDPEDPETSITIYDLPILYLDRSNFTFDISTSQFANITRYDSNNAINKKICNEVELWRLVSPNYNGQFEFSMAKNNGCSKFNVDVTLKPFNPYIHVNPDFKGLYGVDFDDSRGLICGGDFSLPMETTAWSNYELQNKNYQIAFDRQIQHMDFTQEQERTLAKWNIAAGTIQGGVSGAAAGGIASGSPWGAVAGGAAGAGLSIGTGLIDYSMLSERQAENKSLAIDNFNYQLGNIKAQPHSVNKVTPLTYNNKKFPFLEKYVATDQEIEILRNKIEYSSMNISAIGSIREYIQASKTFISGNLIRLEDTGLSAHEVNEIYNILAEGVYI